MIEAWNQDAESIVIFVSSLLCSYVFHLMVCWQNGLFSATVAAALGPSLPDQVSNAQIESAFPAFNLPNFPLVNALWFSSLIISLTCALLAVSFQQWTHRYLMDVRQRGTPCNQARIREYLAEGIHESRIAVLVDVMRVCHQLSFFLFALGLSAYVLATDWTTFGIVSSWFLVWSVLYLWMTVTAISRYNSPYRSPLSSMFYRFVQLIHLARSITPETSNKRPTGFVTSNSYRGFLRRLGPEGMREAIEESVKNNSDDLDSRILEWSFNSFTRDNEFEQFFAAIPDFCDSRAVIDPKPHLLALNDKQEKLSRTLFVWMCRSLTSHLISEPDRQRRVKIFTKVIDALPTIVSFPTLQSVFETWDGLLGSVDFGSAVLRAGGNSDDPFTVFCTQCIVAIVIARAQVYDRQCINLTTRFLTSDLEVRVYSR